jgi:hypothetical protein
MLNKAIHQFIFIHDNLDGRLSLALYLAQQMLKLLAVVAVISITISCSTIKVIHDEFDNSNLAKLELSEKYVRKFERLDGEIQIDRIVFSKNYIPGKSSDIQLFSKFEGYQGEQFHGDTIELNTNGIIRKLELSASRQDNYEEITGTSVTVFTRLAPFTFSDATRSKINIIVLECLLSKDVQEAILNAKSMMLRVYTENIDGISKNTFKLYPDTLRNIKKFIVLAQK